MDPPLEGPEVESRPVAPGQWNSAGLVWNDSGGRVQLLPHQIEHFRRLHSIVQRRTSVMDTSVMGTGKTFTSLALAVAFNIPVFVVCLVASAHMWREVADRLGVRVVEVISYETLRGRADLRKLSHPWLLREDIVKTVAIQNERGETEQVERYTTRFRPTQDLLRVIANGALFVFDEVQKIRNPCAQTSACHTILRNVVLTNLSAGSKRRSFAITLSATPAINIDNIVRHARLLGIITQETLFTRNAEKQIIPKGVAEMLVVCMRLDAGATDRAMRAHPMVDKTSVKSLCYDLWVNVIDNFMVSAMHQVEGSADVHAFNANFSLRRFPFDLRAYRDAMLGMVNIIVEPTPDNRGRVAHLNTQDALRTMVADRRALQRAQLTGVHLFQEIEAAKVRAQIELAVAEKSINPDLKIVFNYRFRKSIEIARHYLARIYGADQVGVITGATDPRDRRRIVDRFNARGAGPVPEADAGDAERRKRRAARSTKRRPRKERAGWGDEGGGDDDDDFGAFSHAFVGTAAPLTDEEERAAVDEDPSCGALAHPRPSFEELGALLDRYDDIGPRFAQAAADGPAARDLPPGECPIAFLVGQKDIISASLNLHEREEGMVRMMFIGASGDVIAIHQARGRFKRAGSRGTAFVYVAFGLLEKEDEEFEIYSGMPRAQLDRIVALATQRPKIVDAEAGYVGVEANMIEALSRKSEVLVNTLKTQVADGEVFPSDYKIIEVR